MKMHVPPWVETVINITGLEDIEKLLKGVNISLFYPELFHFSWNKFVSYSNCIKFEKIRVVIYINE